jgi:hypothetical protein
MPGISVAQLYLLSFTAASSMSPEDILKYLPPL